MDLCKLFSPRQCQSDASAWHDKIKGANFPMILGHEGAGIVESVGDGVTDFKAGDHVIPLFLPQCKKCPVCLHENGNFCYQFMGMQMKGLMPDGTSRLHSIDGKTLHTFMGCGTFSEYTVVPQMSLVKINPDAALEKVCLLGCGVTTGLAIKLHKIVKS